MTYEEARVVAGPIVAETAARRMPPWSAAETDECQPRHGWKDDLRLSETELATLAAWSAAGAPEGDPADAPPPAAIASNELASPDLVVEPVAPFVSSGDADQFRCFVIDPGFTETRYLSGWQFVAGNTKVVHHALLFADPSGQADTLADADGGYDCFGGVGIDGAGLLTAWAPGGVPIELDANVGIRIEAGTKLVMQIHYHPAGTTADPDSTKFQMRFTSAPPDYNMVVALIGNFGGPLGGGDGLLPGPNDQGGPEFLIPAGTKDHVESMQFTLPATINGAPMPDLFVYGAATHMHYVGRDMKIDLEHADASLGEECLLQTPDWNFSWQRFYGYDAPIEELPRFDIGDKLKLRCTYDNTVENPYVVQALKDQKLQSPVDVVLGESTLDEMCLAGVPVVFRVK